MRKKKVLKDIENVINKVSDDIVKRNGGSSADKLCGLSKLVNSYRKLVAKLQENKALHETYEYHRMYNGATSHQRHLEREREVLNNRKGVMR